MIDSFSSTVIKGTGRGKGLGFPTFNLELEQVPEGLEEGIYAGWAYFNKQKYMAAIHYGERPVFNESASFELHIIDKIFDNAPESIRVELIEFLRPVQSFPSKEALATQLSMDIEKCRGILFIA